MARHSPGCTALEIAQTCNTSMRTSETLRQLTKRLEMGQGRPVHFFIAPRGKEVNEVKEVEEAGERRAPPVASVKTSGRCPLCLERRGTQRPLQNSC